MKKDQIFILKDRGIIYIGGKDAGEFLQNIVTNDINKVSDTSSCFASLLTPQGKYLFDFIIAKHKQGYFLDCVKNQADQLLNLLNLYKLNSRIEILNLSNEFEVAVISREKFLTLKNAKDVQGNTLEYNKDTVMLDPRLKNLGGRLIVNLEKLNLSLKNLNLKPEDPLKYYNLSHKLGVPQLNTDKLQEKIFGTECNFEELNGIDFKKGCYIGQENISRIKNRNKLKKRIFSLETSSDLKDDSEILFEDKVVGKIVISKPRAFGIMNLYNPDLSSFLNKDLKCGNAKINIIKPHWLN